MRKRDYFEFNTLAECLWFSFGRFVQAVSDYHSHHKTPAKDPIWAIIHEMADMPLNRANNCTEKYVEETQRAIKLMKQIEKGVKNKPKQRTCECGHGEVSSHHRTPYREGYWTACMRCDCHNFAPRIPKKKKRDVAGLLFGPRFPKKKGKARR